MFSRLFGSRLGTVQVQSPDGKGGWHKVCKKTATWSTSSQVQECLHIKETTVPESVSTSLQYTTVLGKQLGMIVTWTTVSLPQVVKLRLSQALKKTPPPPQTKQAICHHHVCGTVSLLVGGAKMAFNVEGCLCLIQEVHLRPLWLLSDITLPGLATT